MPRHCFLPRKLLFLSRTVDFSLVQKSSIYEFGEEGGGEEG